MERRKNKVTFRLDDTELAKLKRKVGKSGLSQEAYIRSLLRGKQPQDRPPPEYHEYLNMVRGACVNLNQLARVANATGFADGKRIQEHAEAILDSVDQLRDATELPRRIT